MMPEWLFRSAGLASGAVLVAVLGATLFEETRGMIGVRRAAALTGITMFCAGVLCAVLLP